MPSGGSFWLLYSNAGLWHCFATGLDNLSTGTGMKIRKSLTAWNRSHSIRWIFKSVATCWLLCSPNVHAQQKPWEDYSKHIEKAKGIESFGTDLFGDTVDLYTGRLSFHQVDISLPGSSVLPMLLSRSFAPRDPVVVGEGSNLDIPENDQPFGDWTLDIPRVGGVFAHMLNGSVRGPNGILINPGTMYGWSDQRCSGLRVPPYIGEFAPAEYWYGLQADMPGGGELLAPTTGLQMPTDGPTYRWVTTSRTWFSCLPTIKNAGGEGFLAIDQNGTRYWFDWMAKFKEPTLLKSFNYSFSSPTGGSEEVYEQEMLRRRNMLYATRIQDRFGNWIAYTYSNAADQPIRLDAIDSSDGRKVVISYNSIGRIVSASTNGRVWTYSYTADGQSLTNVNLPDGSGWVYNFRNYVNYMLVDKSYVSSCNYPGIILNASDFTNSGSVLSVTHPSGARGEFELRPKLHGRSNVPQVCLPAAGSENPEIGADYSDYVRFYWANSLVRRKISGAGLNEMQWIYTYKASQTPAEAAAFINHPVNYTAPGSWAARPYTYSRLADEGKPITDISTYIIVDPICTSSACAGSVSTEVNGPNDWVRYTYGNSYRYNERILLKKEISGLNSSVSRVENYDYELGLNNLPYQPVIGASRQYQGDGLTETRLRPLRMKNIKQDNTDYYLRIDAFDSFARPTLTTESSFSLP